MSDLPAGFVLDQPARQAPGLPPGFQLDAPAPAAAPQVAAPAPAAAPAEPTWGDTLYDWAGTVGGVVDQAGRGIAQGVASIPALPNSIGNLAIDTNGWIAKKLGAPEAGVTAVQMLARDKLNQAWPITQSGMEGALDSANNATADALGVTRPRGEPDNFAERAANKVGQFVGGAAVPAVGVVSRAENLGLAGARELAPGLVNNMVKKAAVDPARFFRDELRMGAAAGVGAATANEFISPDTPAGAIAEMAASLIAPGVVGAGRAIVSGGNELLQAYRANPEYAAQLVKDNVTDTLLKNSDTISAQVDPANPMRPVNSDPLVEAIMAGKQVPEIPGFRPTTADAAGDGQMAVLEASRAANNPGLFSARSAANSSAVDTAFNKFAPAEAPGSARQAIQEEIDRRIREAITGQTVAEDAATAALGPLTPTSTAAQRGNTVRSALESAKDAAKAKAEQAYGALDLSRPVDYSPLPQRVEDLIAGLSPTEKSLAPVGLTRRTSDLGVAEQVDTGLLDSRGNPITREEAAPPQPLKAANDLRSELGRMAAAARADWRAEKGGNNAARVIQKLQDQVDAFIGQNLTPEEQTQLQAAKDQLRQMKEDFTRQGDPIAEVLARNDGGAPKIRDDRVAGKLATGPEMDRLFRYADTPEVRTAMREEILSKGQFDTPDKIAAFQTRYADQLKRFPGLVDEIKGAGELRMSAQEAAARRKQVERDVGPNSVPGQYAAYSNENAAKAMRNVFNSKDQAAAVDELINFVGRDPEAIGGLRAAFWENLDEASRARNERARTSTGDMPLVAEKMIKFLDDPRKASVAEKLYADQPEHLANIRKLAEAMRGLNTGKRVGNAVNPSGTELARRGSNVTMAEVGSKIYQTRIGRVSPVYVGTYLAGKIARGMVSRQQADAFDQLLDKALVDPEVAAELLRTNNPANRAALASRAKLWLGTSGANMINSLGQDPLEEDETKSAIMRAQ